jgi:hypothetical protein
MKSERVVPHGHGPGGPNTENTTTPYKDSGVPSIVNKCASNLKGGALLILHTPLSTMRRTMSGNYAGTAFGNMGLRRRNSTRDFGSKKARARFVLFL